MCELFKQSSLARSTDHIRNTGECSPIPRQIKASLKLDRSSFWSEVVDQKWTHFLNFCNSCLYVRSQLFITRCRQSPKILVFAMRSYLCQAVAQIVAGPAKHLAVVIDKLLRSLVRWLPRQHAGELKYQPNSVLG